MAEAAMMGTLLCWHSWEGQV